jgi:N-acetylneuraminic acid mutarotase
MKSFYLFLFLLISCSLTAQSWEPVAALPNDKVSDHSFGFALDGKGYFVAGGVSTGYLDDFYEYDPATDTWTQLEDFPGGPRGFGIGDTWDGKAYFGFGFGPFGYESDLWVYDPADESWTELATCPCTPRAHPAFIAQNGKIFMGLGSGQPGNLKDWWEYDMATDSWSQKPDFPSLPRHHPFQFGIGDYIYTGFGHGNGFISNEWYRYDPATEEWDQMATLPGEGRVAGTQFSYNGKGYVLSGDGGDHTSMEEGEFWSYDPELDQWEELPPHPGWSRWAPTSFIIDGWVYLLSGPTNILGNLNYQSDNYKYQLEEINTSQVDLETVEDLLQVFPNPVMDELQLNWKQNIDPTSGQLRVIDAQGRTVIQLDQLPNTLQLSNLSTGIYRLEAITQEGERVVETIVKQ